MARRPGITITELQEQIFAREGFRVSFERLGAGDEQLQPYAYPVMAPQGWTVSDWRRVRLAAYEPEPSEARGARAPEKRSSRH